MLPSDQDRSGSNLASAAVEYAGRRDMHHREEARQAGRYTRLARNRNIFLVLIVLVAWLGEKERLLPLLLVAPALLFTTAMFMRNRAARAWRRARHAVGFYEWRLTCVEERWAGRGKSGLRFLNENHPYAPDLDLFGPGCLFELLCTAKTPMGEQTLADWLLSPASIDEVHQRQLAVLELCPRLDLREELNHLATEIPAGNALETLAEWGRGEPVLASARLHVLAILLMAFAVAAFAAWTLGASPLPFLGVLLLEGLFTFWLRGRVRRLLEPLEQASMVLASFAALLQRLEMETWTSPCLRRLQGTLQTGKSPSSRRMRQLARLADSVPLAFLLLWTVPLGLAVEAWRRAWGPDLRRWLRVLGEWEALGALAGHAYENPEDQFPEVVPEGPCFEATGLGHPLLPRIRCVRNDVRLGGELRVLVVSGSNMSGKSTLLRTVGLNAVLALCGAPVRAHRLRISSLSVGATLRIQDSLQAGRSRFYAEISRLRQLLDLAKSVPPLLFLLDEILQGTNSEERHLGAKAVVRALLGHGAMGLVTTHDLAITEIADILKPAAANVHFEDQFENGALTFDYQMRPGIARSRNALALMRSIGIEV
ncbi:MAG TPA: hypothetical protein VKU02_32870 [Gemmataceae bacterium]|nr:hypothetical protein [Gemmataceae bacterium]